VGPVSMEAAAHTMAAVHSHRSDCRAPRGTTPDRRARPVFLPFTMSTMVRAHPHRGDTGAEAHALRQLYSQRRPERARTGVARWRRAAGPTMTPQWACATSSRGGPPFIGRPAVLP